jgi:Putative transposase, YhgA-like
MQAHDNAYKNMFSSPSAIEQLLSGFVHEDWIERLDFSTLENVNASCVTEDLKVRADDLV